MTQNREEANGHVGGASEGATPYDRAVLGFRNYWYPACFSREVTERRPKAVKLLGDEVVFIRRQGRVYALADECPHRGTRLSRGKHEFPGTPTIACRYHGWVFDVTNGACVAALTDGPDSPVVGKVRVKTYPVQERKGFVWIWMGRMAPVPLEQDVPPLLLKEDTFVPRPNQRLVYGNWRWWMENAPGHVSMLHRDSIFLMTHQLPAYSIGDHAEVGEEGEDGEWQFYRVKGVRSTGDYPGLGTWPRLKWRPWRKGATNERRGAERDGRAPKTIRGERYIPMRTARRLPGTTRIAHLPKPGRMYYAWFVPVDEDHYRYFQVGCYWFKHPLARLAFYATYPLFLYRRFLQFFRLNSQDLGVIADGTDYDKRHGGNWPSPLFGPDAANFAWREFCNTRARGEAVEPATPAAVKEPAATPDA